MAGPDASQVLGRVTLATGGEEFLAERTVAAVKAAVRRHDAEAEFAESTADQLTVATLGELAAPSLFSSTRCVVVRGLENLPDESVDGILGYAAAPADDVALVLVHGGGQKGVGVLRKLRKLPSVTEVATTPLNAREYPGFVTDELRSHGVRIDPETATFLVQAVGQDLRALAAAAHQLASDADGGRVDLDLVKTYFGGRAEVKSFVIADHTLFGRLPAALEELRWALELGTSPVLVTSALAGAVRQVARFKSAPRSMRRNELAGHVGAPPWKIDILRDQARTWSEPGLAEAIRIVARADAAVKGAAHDADYAVEKMILDIVAAKSLRGERGAAAVPGGG